MARTKLAAHWCECGLICSFCGEREVDHVGTDRRCPSGDRGEDTFCDGTVPQTYEYVLSPGTRWDPPESEIRCERCKGER